MSYLLLGWTWVQSYERNLLGSIHLIESIVFATQMGWIHAHSTHYQQGTFGKFKISFWRTSQCVSYSVGIVTWRIAGGAKSPYYRHCAGIVNTDRKTHQFADGSWANGSKKSCKSTAFSVNVGVAELSPKLLFLGNISTMTYSGILPPPWIPKIHQDFLMKHFFRLQTSERENDHFPH